MCAAFSALRAAMASALDRYPFTPVTPAFAEPYDPAKLPVVFVHGAGGQPGNFRYLVEHLDRSRVQPWLVYYPSGLRLEMVGRGVVRWLAAVAARRGFQHVAIVAHTMGGLVSRAAVNALAASGDGASPPSS